VISFFTACQSNKLNRKEIINNSVMLFENKKISYVVLGKSIVKPNVALNLDTTFHDFNTIALIASKISLKEGLESFLLFDSEDSIRRFFAAAKIISSSEGYLGEYVNGYFVINKDALIFKVKSEY
tara:strand:- start:745 stop:1119 length:375 start_codon:yes stop_codon:yes gene_type:complete